MPARLKQAPVPVAVEAPILQFTVSFTDSAAVGREYRPAGERRYDFPHWHGACSDDKMHLTEISLRTGVCRVHQSSKVCVESRDKAGDWLDTMLRLRTTSTLPGGLGSYTATAINMGGGLVVSIRHPDHGLTLSVGVARRANHGRPLWRVMSAIVPDTSCTQPRGPAWFSTIRHASSGDDGLLDAFVLLCAWYWVQRPLFPDNSARNGIFPSAAKEPADFPPATGTYPLEQDDFHAEPLSPIDPGRSDRHPGQWFVMQLSTHSRSIETRLSFDVLGLCFGARRLNDVSGCLEAHRQLLLEAALLKLEDDEEDEKQFIELTEIDIAAAQKKLARQRCPDFPFIQGQARCT